MSRPSAPHAPEVALDAEAESEKIHVVDTEWFRDLMKDIFGTRQGGSRIIIDAEGGSTGVGKSSLAVKLAKMLSYIFEYELTEDDLTLSGAKYLRRWREHPGPEQPSVLILDEVAGAGAGDARRAMSTQNVNLTRAWQLMRKKRIVTITTLAHFSDADAKMRRFADYRLWCLEEPIGFFRPYKVGAGFADGSVMLSGYDDVTRISFPDMDGRDDPLYRDLDQKKDELLDSAHFDADELQEDDPAEEDADREDPDEVRREEQIRTALLLCKPWDDDEGLSHLDASAQLDYGSSWVGDRCREWQHGEHRDLVSKPATAP